MCELNQDDFPYSEFSSVTTQKSRKVRFCQSCFEALLGKQYVRRVWKAEGEIYSTQECRQCADINQVFSEFHGVGWVDPRNLQMDLQECWVELGRDRKKAEGKQWRDMQAQILWRRRRSRRGVR